MNRLIERIKPRPLICAWEITLQCNMRCRHCGSGALYRREHELTTQEALGVCDQLADLGCRRVTLLGGEPLLRPDWHIIARRLTERGINVGIISNGFAITSDVVRKFKQSGMSNFGISIDGPEKVHNFIRCSPLSFKRIKEAIKRLKRAGVPISISTTVNRFNVSELEKLYKLLVDWKVDSWQVQLAMPMGRMRRDMMIRVEDLPKIEQVLLKARREGKLRVFPGCNFGYYSPHEEEIRKQDDEEGIPFWTGCYAGILLVGLESNGNVKGCLALQGEQFIEGNVRKEPLRQIWERTNAFKFTRGFDPGMLKGSCKDCKFGEICRGGCPCMSFSARGSLYKDPYCFQGI